MFVVIQEIQLKKLNRYGAHKGLEAYSIEDNGGRVKYAYRYIGERFERPIMAGYKISVHESYRERGKVKKRQFHITTVSFYDLVEYSFYDCHNENRVLKIAEALNTSAASLCEMIYAKIDPLVKRCEEQFRQTPEYNAKHGHDEIIQKYTKAKAAFAERYFVDAGEYDYCYNVYGELMNRAYLDKIIDNARSYSEPFSGNYAGADTSDYSYGHPFIETTDYSPNERALLKKFYKALSLKYHPDVNQGADTTKEMQLLNKLKEQWGV